MISGFGNLSLQQLRRAVAIKEQITDLEAELSRILGGSSSPSTSRGRGRRLGGRAAKRTGNNNGKQGKPGRRRMSAKARAKMAAAARARWAKVKAAGKNRL